MMVNYNLTPLLYALSKLVFVHQATLLDTAPIETHALSAGKAICHAPAVAKEFA